MGSFFSTLAAIWTLLFSWMPVPLAVFCTVAIGIIVIFLIIKLIGFILDAIPFF